MSDYGRKGRKEERKDAAT